MVFPRQAHDDLVKYILQVRPTRWWVPGCATAAEGAGPWDGGASYSSGFFAALFCRGGAAPGCHS